MLMLRSLSHFSCVLKAVAVQSGGFVLYPGVMLRHLNLRGPKRQAVHAGRLALPMQAFVLLRCFFFQGSDNTPNALNTVGVSIYKLVAL